MNKKQLITLLIVIVVLVIGGLAYYQSSRDTFVANTEGEKLSKEEVAVIIAAVEKHIRLPEGEEPLIATVADIDALLPNEPFYRGAKNGDILLLYATAGKAILYDQENDVLINVGPIIVDEEAGAGVESGITEEDTTSTDTE